MGHQYGLQNKLAANADAERMKKDLNRDGDMIIAVTPGNKKKSSTRDGFVGNHAYTVLDVFTGQPGAFNLDDPTMVTLFNPHGNDTLDTADGVNDGIFQVPWRTFIRNFASYVTA